MEKLEIIKFNAPELNSIEKSKAEKIKATFEPMAQMLTEFEESYNSLIKEAQNGITKEVTVKAKMLRIDIGKVRIQTEKIRKQEKEEFLRAGKAIDGVSNILKWAVSDKENKLKEIEDFFEIQEQKRIEALQLKRVEILSQYVEDAHERDLSKLADDEFEALLAMKKKELEDRIEAEKRAEEERIENERVESLRIQREVELRPYYQFLPPNDIKNYGLISEERWKTLIKKLAFDKQKFEEEQEKQRQENERLKKEAEEKAKAEEKRREKELAEKKALEEQLKVERKERERVAREEKLKREKLEAELRLREEKERKAQEAKEAKLQEELNKGDKSKVEDIKSELKSIKTKYTFKSSKNKKMYKDVNDLLDKVIDHIEKMTL